MKMRISFELDQTLLTTANEFATEKQNLFQKVLRFEKLRLGAVELMSDIISRGNEIAIYTSSTRPRHYIHELFLRHGLEINNIINKKKHISSLGIEKRTLAKYPPAFDIETHIDCSDSVSIDGKIFGFKTIIIKPDNVNWVEDIKRELF